MAEKPEIKIGYLKITDHLILGVTDLKLKKGMEKFEHCTLKPVLKNGWNEVADALSVKSLDGAFLLAPTAMDMFKAGVDLKLLLFAHKSGSVLVKSKNAHIETIEDFAGKIVLIPYQLSVHNMLFHKLLSEKGLKPGRSTEKGIDVILEVVAPFQMPEAIELDEEGEIGGFIVAEPFGSQVVAKGHGEEFCLSKDLWPNHPCCVFVMRNEIIEKHPEAIQEICNSFVRSGLAIDAQPEPASIIGGNFLSQDKDVIKKVLTDPPDRILTGELFPIIDDLDTIQKYMMDEMKIMTSLIDLEKFVDTGFARQAGAK
ncbi:ABC transporter substrate-binding protein [Desulfobacula toluolica]|uniref:Putative ABC-type nitrate/sulfonate/bicarbonate transport system, periplasmic binding protein n=1 Tax=Desulfobacula toluolica (strain DSM 7467 / Tol2) TaxID=651182 RepID=K0NP18_DESTT|nr:ABC transporter substrate-binding protein [Desulfobacula toluolica]CCK80512.1 putative ABC-type nitrate/sulfonate/bicarbonate transport system, periplasmic binding protein [Desulfobacula toluolica Tol2]